MACACRVDIASVAWVGLLGLWQAQSRAASRMAAKVLFIVVQRVE